MRRRRSLAKRCSARCVVGRRFAARVQFATSLRLPRGKPVLVGGIDIPTTDETGHEESGDAGLYLVVTVHAGP